MEGEPPRTLSSFFDPPVAAKGPDGSLGWWRFPWTGFNPPEEVEAGGLEVAWHGSPLEALYAIVGYGGLRGHADGGRAAVEGPG
eukprot:3013160-Alexandrium_andersonii.AAC.1